MEHFVPGYISVLLTFKQLIRSIIGNILKNINIYINIGDILKYMNIDNILGNW